jgi:hypothetical protein
MKHVGIVGCSPPGPALGFETLSTEVSTLANAAPDSLQISVQAHALSDCRFRLYRAFSFIPATEAPFPLLDSTEILAQAALKVLSGERERLAAGGETAKVSNHGA